MGLLVVSAHPGVRMRWMSITPEHLMNVFTWTLSLHSGMVMGVGMVLTPAVTLWAVLKERQEGTLYFLFERPVSRGVILTLKAVFWGAPAVVCATVSAPATVALAWIALWVYGAPATAMAVWSLTPALMEMVGRGMVWLAAHSLWWVGMALLASILVSRWWRGMLLVMAGMYVLMMVPGPPASLWFAAFPVSMAESAVADPDRYAPLDAGALGLVLAYAAGAVALAYRAIARHEYRY
jgi:ABC-type transport system involved in multi-copper enzyme maturation permease subunit